MAPPAAARKRTRGEIEVLPSGSLRVRVYAGTDPVTKKRHYLVETIPAGRGAEREAEKVRTRLLSQVDERRNPRTRATLDQLLDRWLDVVELEATTRVNYRSKLDKHVRPVLGRLPLTKVDPETLESFYASLRKCGSRCGGRKYVEHRKAGEHGCTDKCRPHECRGLSASTVRQIHWILSGAFERAVRWRWLGINPASQASPPSLPHPDPHPPSLDEALVSEDGANLLMRSTPIAFAAKGRYWVNNHAHVLRPLGDGDVDFWAQRLEALDVTTVVSGAAQPKLTAGALMGLRVSAPDDVDEQRRIAAYLVEQTSKIDMLIAESERFVELSRERRAALITAAVTGQIDVREMA